MHSVNTFPVPAVNTFLVPAVRADGAMYGGRPPSSARLAAPEDDFERQARQARNALDAFGFATIAVRAGDGRLLWQTPLARDLLARHCGAAAQYAPAPVAGWLRRHLDDALARIEPPPLAMERGAQRLTFRLHQQIGEDGEGGEWLIVMREETDAAPVDAIREAFGLTAREAEILCWVAKGKINRDIAAIVGASAATVKKHLERVYAKLGVETRTAAAAMVMRAASPAPPASRRIGIGDGSGLSVS